MRKLASVHAAFVFCLLTFTPAAAQPRVPAPRADWGKWERLVAAQPRATPTGPLSPDGRWLVYGIARGDGRNELRLVSIADGTTKNIAFGSNRRSRRIRSGSRTQSVTPKPSRRSFGSRRSRSNEIWA